MNLWPVEHFFPPFFSRSAEVHFFGSTSYEIHILVTILKALGIIGKFYQKEIKKKSSRQFHHSLSSSCPFDNG